MKIVAGRGLPVMDRSTESTDAFVEVQDTCRLEKYSNIQDCLEKSLKIKFTLKSA